MKQTGKSILIRFQKQWQIWLWLEVFLYAFSSAILVWFLTQNWFLSLISFALIFVMALLFKKPWEIDLEKTSNYIDESSNKLEYSSWLLLQEPTELSGLAKLQQQKISNALEAEIKRIKPEHHLKTAIITSVLLVVIGYLGFYTGISEIFNFNRNAISEEENMSFEPIDFLAVKQQVPVLKNQLVTINHPSYTGLTTTSTSKMNIKALEGSRVTWNLQFDASVDSVSLESMGKHRKMMKTNLSFSGSTTLNNSGFYNFKFTDTSGATYSSDLFTIEVIKDKTPVIRLDNLKQFTSFEYTDNKVLNFGALIIDDFGVANAHIIATVSKGTGESVKFREEQLEFDTPVSSGKKQLNLSKTIDLDQMNMEPGDELYFYIEAKDLKQPKENTARSETYFAVIKDTINYGPGVEGGLGVDLMPDYFRSQRQLIIDTEKLIAQSGKISKEEFNSTSNDLGFDQKSLRLKYGQFMGDEAEGAIANGGEIIEDNDHDHDQEEDPLTEYSHAHDSDNEHNLVADSHDHDQDENKEEEGPLADYLHDHGDPESSSLFTDSLKSKLRQALNIMWDAELHLRLYKPEKSLPYQYEALELIQEIKNSARIYVHRIGFDPPPIKENARLSGDLKDIDNFNKKEERDDLDQYLSIKQTILRLEELKISDSKPKDTDRKLFKKAGNELAKKAIAEPGRFLKTLQQLKQLGERQQISQELIIEVQKGLLKALPKIALEPQRQGSFGGKLNELVLKELELNE